MSERIAIAREHWGDEAPDWIVALAKACDEKESQNKVAQLLGYSAAVVSQALRARYPGDLARLEQAVRAELMREEVACPALGIIALSECLEHRANADNYRSPNPLRARMRRACNSCPIHLGGCDEQDDCA